MNEIERKNRQLKVRAIITATDHHEAALIAQALVLYREVVERIGQDAGAGINAWSMPEECTRLANLYRRANAARDEYEAGRITVEPSA